VKTGFDSRNPASGADGFAAVSNRALPKGFTLIELLVVITIIAILAALVLNTAGFIQKKAARSRAETEIAALSAALESYKADNGDYPGGTNAPPTGVNPSNTSVSPMTTNAAPGNNAYLRTNLSPTNDANGKVYKVYFEFSKNMGTNLVNGPITDPFGENYGYRYPGIMNGSNFFDLWSRSASGNTNIWTKNW
jgi:type II secretion system protein G